MGSSFPSDLAAFRSQLSAPIGPEPGATQSAIERNAQLTKPPGALGRLEDLAIWYCGWRGDAQARITAPQIIVFAGNHGVARRGVSAFPSAVTAQMVANFEAGGAAINQLAEIAGARLDVHALDLDKPTEDFTQAAAMDEVALVSALKIGWEAVDLKSDLLVVGEMGIGNTTSAAALFAKLLGGTAHDWAGRGTGVDDAALALKGETVDAALERVSGVHDRRNGSGKSGQNPRYSRRFCRNCGGGRAPSERAACHGSHRCRPCVCRICASPRA